MEFAFFFSFIFFLRARPTIYEYFSVHVYWSRRRCSEIGAARLGPSSIVAASQVRLEAKRADSPVLLGQQISDKSKAVYIWTNRNRKEKFNADVDDGDACERVISNFCRQIL